MLITLSTTRSGFPALWERGGGMTSGGSATIITGRRGEKLRPVYVPRGGHLSCGQHALICVYQGYHVVTASVRRGSREACRIVRIDEIRTKKEGEVVSAEADVSAVAEFYQGEWDKEPAACFEAAIEAAYGKASSYHCRFAFYIDDTPRHARTATRAP